MQQDKINTFFLLKNIEFSTSRYCKLSLDFNSLLNNLTYLNIWRLLIVFVAIVLFVLVMFVNGPVNYLHLGCF